MSYEKCRICGEYGFSRTHTCGPRFEVRYVDDGDENFQTIYAADAQDAAEKFHDRHFSDSDYAMNVTVIVRNPERRRCTFDVTVETVPEMHAREKGEWGQPEPEADDEKELDP